MESIPERSAFPCFLFCFVLRWMVVLDTEVMKIFIWGVSFFVCFSVKTWVLFLHVLIEINSNYLSNFNAFYERKCPINFQFNAQKAIKFEIDVIGLMG